MWKTAKILLRTNVWLQNQHSQQYEASHELKLQTEILTVEHKSFSIEIKGKTTYHSKEKQILHLNYASKKKIFFLIFI